MKNVNSSKIYIFRVKLDKIQENTLWETSRRSVFQVFMVRTIKINVFIILTRILVLYQVSLNKGHFQITFVKINLAKSSDVAATSLAMTAATS